MDDEFDYVIVGGGSAGCVLAARLSQDRGTRVLLLEAGKSDWHPLISIPLGVGRLRQARMYDWGYRSEPQAELDGRHIELFRGKVLGGSSSVNFMAHNRGNESDFARWVRLGLDDWSYDDVLPYFKRLESWREGVAAHRGDGGPIGITYTCRSDPLGWAVLDAARSAGFPIFDDLNDREPNGFGLAQSAIDAGRRASASRAYLRPARDRPNLVVRTGALASRILIDRNRAVGVEYILNAQQQRARAACEVLLCAGAINSPQLLMLSGIGDADALKALGIASVQHLPGVGANFQDHLAVALNHRRIGSESPLHKALRLDRVVAAFAGAYIFGKGAATVLPAGVNGIIRSCAGLDAPDMQIVFGAGALEGRPWLPGLWDWQDMFYLRPIVAHPKSRGSLRLASADPRHRPRIDPRYLSEPSDLSTLRSGLRIVRDIVSQRSLDAFRGAELTPGVGCESDNDLDAYIRRTATTMQHASCTCKMGNDEMSVVDSEMRVRGVERLRVVDASVMPEILSCNINASVLAIAERAADMLRGHSATTRELHKAELAAV